MGKIKRQTWFLAKVLHVYCNKTCQERVTALQVCDLLGLICVVTYCCFIKNAHDLKTVEALFPPSDSPHSVLFDLTEISDTHLRMAQSQSLKTVEVAASKYPEMQNSPTRFTTYSAFMCRITFENTGFQGYVGVSVISDTHWGIDNVFNFILGGAIPLNVNTCQVPVSF